MENRSKIIALSGISTALAVVFILGAIFVPNLTLSMYVLASLSISLPLMKDKLLGAVLAYAASSIIAFLLGSINVLPFILFFGIYTIVAWVLDFKLYSIEKLNKAVKIAIICALKIGFYFAAFFACFKLMNLVLTDFTIFNIDWTIPLLLAAGFVVFSIYDLIYRFIFKTAKAELLKRVNF